MPIIREQLLIRAAPEAVYALIADVSGYPRFSRAIRRVERLNPRRYRWQLRLAGIPLHWEGDVVVDRPPKLFAWRSDRGFENNGEFRLTPVAGGTRVTLTLHYHLPLMVLNLLASGLERPLIALFRHEVLGNVKRQLESGATGSPTDSA